MLIFKDLEFKRKKMGGVGASHTFENGITISVQASKGNYSTPKENLYSPSNFSSFEVAVIDGDGDFITKNLFQNHGNDVRGWMDRADISILMIKIQFDK
jgi:hypothetical protein|tara:strand:+ start:162 stop:458 length:297 start_codon:yes stop_codon:yes gene_type:complete